MIKARQYAYYPLFWYSVNFNLPISDISHSLSSRLKNSSISHFRLISVLFDCIYIPRTHITNHYNLFMPNIIGAILQSELAKWLINNNIIVSSVERGLDNASSDSFIIDTISRYPWMHQYKQEELSTLIGNIDTIYIDNESEAQNNISSFSNIFDGFYDHEFSTRYKNIVELSIDPNIGFFHESFLRNLRISFSGVEFETIWRATNSLYVTTGAPNIIDIFPLYFESIEHHMELSHCGLLRPIYSPRGISAFLNITISPKAVRGFLSSDESTFIRFLDSEVYKYIKNDFTNAYISMCRELNNYYILTGSQLDLRGEATEALIAAYLSGNLDKHLSDLLSGAGSGLGGAASLLDPVTGAITKVAIEASKKYVADTIGRIMIKRRHPSLMAMADLIEGNFG